MPAVSCARYRACQLLVRHPHQVPRLTRHPVPQPVDHPTSASMHPPLTASSLHESIRQNEMSQALAVPGEVERVAELLTHGYRSVRLAGAQALAALGRPLCSRCRR
jgi:hypothetical protein